MSPLATIPGLEDWTTRLREVEALCPWAGPRPYLDPDWGVQLVGRERDRREFLREVTNPSHRLILLTGLSGVGKTSLLHTGLVPDLEKARYKVIVCREWHGSDDGVEAAPFLAGKVFEQIKAAGLVRDKQGTEYSEDAELFYELQDDHGHNAVIVLDQFEELLRYAPDMREELFDLLLDINHKLDVRLVLSFRQEHLLDMRRLETNAVPFSFTTYVLENIPPADENRVSNAYWLAVAPNSDPRWKGQAVIDDAAAHEVARQWDGAFKVTPGVDPDDPDPDDSGAYYREGMLQLQGLLYTLHARTEGACISKQDVLDFVAECPPPKAKRGQTVQASADATPAVFAAALRDSISYKLNRARAAAVAVDPYLVEGTADVVARAVRHLSSGGFKLEREALELGERTLESEFEILRSGIASEPGEVVPIEAFAALLAIVIDGCRVRETPEGRIVPRKTLTRAQIAAAADARIPELDGYWAMKLAEVDRMSTTSGPMMGLAPAAVLIEEMRRFAFALAWLRETTLVRLHSPGPGGVVVSLIHDGFGEALRLWSDARVGNPRGALHALTAPRGGSFEWDDDERSEISKGNEKPRIITNLRWRGASVSAHLRNVVFVNCDFRGVYFHHCTLDGVTFVNCMMEGVIVIDSTITPLAEGVEPFAPAARPRGEQETTFEEPVFVINAGLDPDELKHQATYRGVPGTPVALLSTGTDIPAVAVTAVSDVARTEWAPQYGGMAVFGSRVSAMLFRRCEGVGDIRLRHSRGSGLDTLEYHGGRVHMFDVTLRHVRFAAGGHTEEVEILSEESVISQLWLGEGLHGSFGMRGGALVQAWNESREITTEVVGTRVFGTVGLVIGDDCPSLDSLDGERSVREGVVINRRFFAAARAMDHLEKASAAPDESLA